MDSKVITLEEIGRKLVNLDTRLVFRKKEDNENGGIYFSIDSASSRSEICSSREMCDLFSKENESKINKFLSEDCVLKFEEVPAGERSTRFYNVHVLLSKFFFDRLETGTVNLGSSYFDKETLLIEDLLREVIMKPTKAAEFWKLYNRGIVK